MNTPSLGIPYKSENISPIYFGYILGYIYDIFKIHPTSWIHLEYIPDLSQMTDESGIYLFIPNISGIPRLAGRENYLDVEQPCFKNTFNDLYISGNTVKQKILCSCPLRS
jgi:hypothetical protein